MSLFISAMLITMIISSSLSDFLGSIAPIITAVIFMIVILFTTFSVTIVLSFEIFAIFVVRFFRFVGRFVMIVFFGSCSDYFQSTISKHFMTFIVLLFNLVFAACQRFFCEERMS